MKQKPGTTQKPKKTPARRFATQECDEDVAKAKIASVPKKTQTDTRYCHRIWEEWRDSRNSSAATREVVPDDITQMDNTSLQHWMSQFVLEVRKKGGTEYPPNTLYHIICGLQRYIRGSHPEVDFFQDWSFSKFWTLR